MAALEAPLLAVLRCPACRGGLEPPGGQGVLACRACGARYACREGTPILLEAGTARELIEARERFYAREIRAPRLALLARRLAPPKVCAWGREGAAVRAALSEAVPAGRPPVGLNIGHAGPRAAPWVYNADIGPYPGVDVVLDALRLPVGDGTLDAVLCFRVIEHVRDPARLVAEVHRALRPGARAHFVVPFLEPYHLAPADYFRASEDGVRELFRGFEDLRVEVAAGPSATLAWVLMEWLSVGLPGSGHPLVYGAAKAFWGWVLYPLRWLDAWFRRRPRSAKVANSFYVCARKPR
ncbi:MAG: methyltransferase domain-containing protein [Planctomycetes bacterium]|nr:methyltransferase domain-containing protein [Planctomycetota bacterium]